MSGAMRYPAPDGQLEGLRQDAGIVERAGLMTCPRANGVGPLGIQPAGNHAGTHFGIFATGASGLILVETERPKRINAAQRFKHECGARRPA